MLIKALCDYAEVIAESDESEKVEEGFEKREIHYRIMLMPNGEVSDIIDVCKYEEVSQNNGKIKKVIRPQTIILPKRTQKTGIESNIIEHRPLYIFGLSKYKKDGEYIYSTEDKTDKAKKSHEAFVKMNKEFFEGLESEICIAYRLFLENWICDAQVNNERLLSILSKYDKVSYGFALNGFKGNLEDDEQFKEKYRNFIVSRKNQLEGIDEDLCMCSVMGELLPVARIHEKIRFPGGNTTGCVLVGMKESAFESYGKKQSHNSNISERAMLEYTQILNRILTSNHHYTIIDNMSIIYFAIKKNDDMECDFFSLCLGNSNAINRKQVEYSIDKYFENVRVGKSADLSNIEVDENIDFYVFGLSPNSSRISQKFAWKSKFGEIFKNVMLHQSDICIYDNSLHQIGLRELERELISPKSSNEKVSVALSASLMMSILQGTLYPIDLLETIIRRIKLDSGEDSNHFIKMNDVRIGIIKGYLNRKSRKNRQKEEITMELEMDETLHPAYVCGEIFAIYEKIQKESVSTSGGKELNRTIKDSYFSSACTRPAVIFPRLSRLSMNHMKIISRENEGRAVYFNKLLEDKMSFLEGRFPSFLDLESQGRFIIGYYKQSREFYANKKKNQNNTEE